MSLTLAIIGRPNVGKSTLFNRLVGRRQALVDNRPGVTRDRREGKGRLGPLEFTVVDTAGLEEVAAELLESRMREQTERAIDDADVLLLLVDGRAGLTPMDRHFADWARAWGVPTVLAVNKAEGRAASAGLLEAFELGLGEPVALSAEHGEGMGELYEAITLALPEAEALAEGVEPAVADTVWRMAIVGRPNTGKSTLINRLCGAERVLTGPEPGVTRDSIAVDVEIGGRRLQLVDTAGLRRRARITDRIEKLATEDTLRAIRHAQVVVLLIDALEGVDKQDLTIANRALEGGRALVVGLNKWDQVTRDKARRQELESVLERGLPQVRDLAVVTLSARTGRGLEALVDTACGAGEVWSRRVATAPLNAWLGEVIEVHPPPLVAGRRLKLRYITQATARPPTFVVFVNRPSALPDSYQRYMVNSMRERFDLPGTPIRLRLRGGKNPYATRR